MPAHLGHGSSGGRFSEPARIDATASWGFRPEGCCPSAEPPFRTAP